MSTVRCTFSALSATKFMLRLARLTQTSFLYAVFMLGPAAHRICLVSWRPQQICFPEATQICRHQSPRTAHHPT